MTDVVAYPATPGSAGKRVMMTTSPITTDLPGRPNSRGRPGSRGSITPPKTPSADKLTTMPDYMRPVVKSAVRKWKKLHEDHMMSHLNQKRKEKKGENQSTREDAKHLARQIPMEVLAGEWLKHHAATAETRAYLVDKILPTLIMGVEKLLNEVDSRELAEVETTERNFNPLNFLAQYLMRNNPRYSNFSEASPYIRRIRQIAEELKTQLFDIDENRLARIKAEAKRKREEREEEERLREMEKQRRQQAVRQQFKEWNVNIDGKVELALIQNALRSFSEMVDRFPADLQSKAQFSQEVEPTDETGKSLVSREFQAYLTKYVDDMPSEVFDAFMSHMSQCAKTYRSGHERDQRKSQLTTLFVACDHGAIGLLDRHRILNLFEMFWDKSGSAEKNRMRNPRKWPVVEMSEMPYDYLSDDDSDDAEQKPTFIDNNVDVTEQTVGVDKNKTDVESKKDEKAETDKDKAEPTHSTDKTAEEDKEKVEQKANKEEITAEKADDVEKEADGIGEKPVEAEPTSDERKEEESKEVSTEEATQEEVGEKEETKAQESEQVEEKKAGRSGEDAAAVSVVEDKGGNEPKKEKTNISDKAPSQELTASDQPPATQQSKVSFADGTAFERERSLLMSRSQSQASIFDENSFNVSQFVQVTETFMGDDPSMETFGKLVRFIKEGYLETEEEKMERLLKVKKEAQAVKRRLLLNQLFEMWDNDGSGFIDLDEVETVAKKYKDGLEDQAIDIAKAGFKQKSRFQDNRLSKREFRDFVYKAVENMAGGSEAFDMFTDFIHSNVERSYQERVRGEARKKWLQQIVSAGEQSGAKMEPVYKTIFQALYKDAETHGNGKRVSAYIAMLEKNTTGHGSGTTVLRYTAATNDHAHYIVNKILYREMKGISFASIDSGKPIHVPRVNNHGNIHFWNVDNKTEEKDGSFIVVPLKDRRKKVFGLLGIDTLNDPHNRAIFITHEIQFFQGVAKAFSIAYHHVDILQKTMRISESAIAWIHRRSPNVHEIIVYMVEPDGKGEDYVLRKMMNTDHKGHAHMVPSPPSLERKDNLFRDYLFKCVDTSESVTADAYGQRHLAIPLRDYEGRAIVVVDISIGDLKSLPKVENREMMRMLKLLQMAYDEISRESREGEKTVLLEAEHDSDVRVEILFDRLMLMELRDNVSKLDAQAYAELKSYKEPPRVVHQILKAVLAVFYPDQAVKDEFSDWTVCKKYVNPTLNHKILAYDPTQAGDDVPVDLINEYLTDVPHGMVSKHGSIPAQYLYNWVFVCVSLIEHTRKMAQTRDQALDGPEKTGQMMQKKEESQEEEPSTKQPHQPVSDEGHQD